MLHHPVLNDTTFDSDDGGAAVPRVMQHYIEPLLTPCGRKFHIRALVMAVGDLDVYLYKNMRILLATKPYTDSASSSSSDPFMHLTNQSVNASHPEYDEAVQNQSFEAEASSSLLFDAQRVRTQIEEIIQHVFTQLSLDKKRFFALDNCYELFGFDFMLDPTQRVWLLEANPDPSLAMYAHQDLLLGHDVFESLPPTFRLILPRTQLEALRAFRRLAVQSNGNN